MSNDSSFKACLKTKKIKYVIVLGCSEIFSSELLNTYPVFINFHPSLLPAHKGPNPLSSVLYHNEKTTGVSVHRIVKKIDSGSVYIQKSCSIDPEETFSSLSYKLSFAALASAQELAYLLQNNFELKEIDLSQCKASYYKLPNPSKFEIDLKSDSLKEIHRKIRSYGESKLIFSKINGTCYYMGKSRFFSNRFSLQSQIREVVPLTNSSLLVQDQDESLIITDISDLQYSDLTGFGLSKLE